MCPGDPGRSRSGMDTRPGNGRCDNLVCTVGVYLNFIGALAVTWTWESGGGGDAAGGSFFVLSDRGRDDAPPVFPRGHFRPTNIAPLPPSARAFSLPVSTPSFSRTLLPLYPSFSLRPLALHLLLSLLGRFQYLSKFSEPAMNKLFPDFEYLSVLRGNGTAIEGPTAERTGMGDID